MDTNTSDIHESLERALREQGWLYGEWFNRIGNPFTWVDGGQMAGFTNTPPVVRFLQYLSMSGEIYETPAAIRSTDHDDVLNDISDRLAKAFMYFAGFAKPEDIDFDQYIQSTALVKTQDYSAIRTWCQDIPSTPRHMDIGPGLGANMIYSRYHLNARYMAVDAFAPSYDVQRRFMRGTLQPSDLQIDSIAAESFGLSHNKISDLIDDPKYAAANVASWHLPLVNDETLDLVSATWVLNEVTPSGIMWLLHHAARLLKPGGYFYIRDSSLLKPNRHDISYDEALLKIGFEKVAWLDIVNRVDMHGIPRIYRKTDRYEMEFIDLFDKFTSRFAVTAHGGQFNQKSTTDQKEADD